MTVGAFQIATQSTWAVVNPRPCATSYSVGACTISLLSRHGSTRGGTPGARTSRPLKIGRSWGYACPWPSQARIRSPPGCRRAAARCCPVRCCAPPHHGCPGIALGLLAGFGATQASRTLLFGVGTLDMTTYVAVIVLVVLVVTLAAYVPARRAAGIDPVVLLRRE